MRRMTTEKEQMGMSQATRELIEKLDRDHWLSDEELLTLVEAGGDEGAAWIFPNTKLRPDSAFHSFRSSSSRRPQPHRSEARILQISEFFQHLSRRAPSSGRS